MENLREIEMLKELMWFLQNENTLSADGSLTHLGGPWRSFHGKLNPMARDPLINEWLGFVWIN